GYYAASVGKVLVEYAADIAANFLERSVLFVVVEAAGNRVASDVDVGPAIVVEVGRTDSEAVGADGKPLHAVDCRRGGTTGDRDAGSLRNILERPVTPIVVQNIGPAAQSLRSAPYGKAIIPAVLGIARLRCCFGIEIYIVRDKQVQEAVPVIIYKTAP